MIYLGIDPGTATTGFALIESSAADKNQFSILTFGVISTEKTESDASRLEILFADLTELIKEYKPDKVGIEKLYFANNQATAMTVSQARGVALLACQQARLNILELTPLQVKNTLCGYGKADKKQVQQMVKMTFKLKEVPKPDDAADALAIALCAAVWKQ